MTKQEKADAVEQIVSRLEQSNTVYLTDYSGLTVEQSNNLRGLFRKADVEFRVLKNTLVRLAMERIGGYDDILEDLSGPTAVAFTEDPSAPSKVIKKFQEDTDQEKPALKAAFVEGALFGPDQLAALASLKSKAELIGDIIGLLMSPATNVVSALQAQGGNLAGAIQTIAEREEA